MTSYDKFIVYRGIGAVVYGVPELENHLLLKISLRSLGSEDTTTVSQVRSTSPYFSKFMKINMFLNVNGLFVGIWRRWP